MQVQYNTIHHTSILSVLPLDLRYYSIQFLIQCIASKSHWTSVAVARLTGSQKGHCV